MTVARGTRRGVPLALAGLLLFASVEAAASSYCYPQPAHEGDWLAFWFVNDLSPYGYLSTWTYGSIPAGAFQGQSGPGYTTLDWPTVLGDEPGATAQATAHVPDEGDYPFSATCSVNADRPPYFETPSDGNHFLAVAGSSLTIQLIAWDPDGPPGAQGAQPPYLHDTLPPDGVLYSASGPPNAPGTWVLDSVKGIFQFSPRGEHVGQHTVTFSAISTRNQLTTPITVHITVEPGPPRLVGTEVTQAVQDWGGSARLIADKMPTYFRAYVEPGEGSGSLMFSGRLRGERDGVELVGSPLPPFNPGRAVIAAAGAARRRHDFNASLNFHLPRHWVSGEVFLSLEPAAGQELVCSPSCARQVTFSSAGTPRIHFVGVRWKDATGFHKPSAADFLRLWLRLLAMFPVAAIDVTWSEYDWYARRFEEGEPDLDELLDVLDASCTGSGSCGGPGGSLYYGVVPGTPSGQYGVARGSVATGFMLPGVQVWGKYTHAHELAHTLGLYEDVNASIYGFESGMKKGACGELAGASAPDFPMHPVPPGGTRYPILGPLPVEKGKGFYGVDTYLEGAARPRVMKTERFDVMSYCGSQTTWVSASTYTTLYNAINARFPPPPPPPSAAPSLLVVQDYAVARGWIDVAAGTAGFLPFGHMTTGVPPPLLPFGPYALELRDETGALIWFQQFEPPALHSDPPSATPAPVAFAIPVAITPLLDDVAEIALTLGAADLVVAYPTLNAPTVQLTYPNGGESLADTATIQWAASDLDGGPLWYTVDYSSDGGTSWQNLEHDWTETQLVVDVDSLPGTSDGRIRVVASDGTQTGYDESDAGFSVPGHTPSVVVTSPADLQLAAGTQPIWLEAAAYDLEDGVLAGLDLVWESDLDGPLGQGEGLLLNAMDLSEGTHEITVRATDAGAAVGTSSVVIEVMRTPPDGDGDGVPDVLDACPLYATSDVGDADEDGVGDPCECGDVDDDGWVDGLDVAAYRAYLADPSGAPLSPTGLVKCAVIAPPGCDVLAVSVLRRALASPALPPGVMPVCAAAVGSS